MSKVKKFFMKIPFFIVVCLLSFRLSAAGPAMHVALGEYWLATFAPEYKEEEKKLFLLGTVFPDIRYLGVIKREQSHFKDVTLKQIFSTPSPFERGMLFHSFVDDYRGQLVKKMAIEKKLTELPPKLKGPFLKLIEDQILFGQKDWSQFRTFLVTIPEEEKKFGMDMTTLMEWHTGLTLYFTTPPSFILMQIALLEKSILMLDAPTVKSWSALLPKYASDPAFKAYVNDLLKDFNHHLSLSKATILVTTCPPTRIARENVQN